MFGLESQLFLALFLILTNAFFVAAEFAIVKVRCSQIDDLARRGSPLARFASKVVHNLETSLAAAQMGITFASLGLGWIGEPAVARLITPVLGTLGVISPTVVHSVSFSIAFVFITALHIIIGEQMPKFLGLRRSQEIVLWTSVPFSFFTTICYPFIWALNVCANSLLRLFGVHTVSVHSINHSEDELRFILSESQRQGALPAQKATLLENVLDLAERSVMEIMMPRPDIDYLSLSKSWDENLATLYQTGHTRYPLCETDLDHVLGIVHIKDIFLRNGEVQSSADLLKIKREVLFVPATRPIEGLQQEFQQRRLHMAVVIDEYGSTTGLVTMEDILEELVGEIQDEFDTEVPDLLETEEGTVVHGQMPLADVTYALGLPEVEIKDAHTIAGYVHAQLGRIGRIGDIVSLDTQTVKIIEMSGQRITRVLVAPALPALPMAEQQLQLAMSGK
ncbi:MAG: hemolysin family protein [Candidatus Binatia bacterium]